EDVVTEGIQKERHRPLSLVAVEDQPLHEPCAAVDPSNLLAGLVVLRLGAEVTHARRDLILEGEDVLGGYVDVLRRAGESSTLVDGELAPVTGDGLEELVVPPHAQVEKHPLVEEGAVQLTVHIQRIVLGLDPGAVEGPARVDARAEGRPALEGEEG